MIGYTIGATLSANGGVSRGVCKQRADHKLVAIEERHVIERTDNGNIVARGKSQMESKLIEDNDLCSMNMWGFDGTTVFELLEEEFVEFIKANSSTTSLATAELSLATAMDSLIKKQKCTVSVLQTTEAWFGVTFQADKLETIAKFKQLEEDGLYPHGLWNNFVIPK
jgi:hypothetical protein